VVRMNATSGRVASGYSCVFRAAGGHGCTHVIRLPLRCRLAVTMSSITVSSISAKLPVQCSATMCLMSTWNGVTRLQQKVDVEWPVDVHEHVPMCVCGKERVYETQVQSGTVRHCVQRVYTHNCTNNAPVQVPGRGTWSLQLAPAATSAAQEHANALGKTSMPKCHHQC
jgi:hypothetical protein